MTNHNVHNIITINSPSFHIFAFSHSLKELEKICNYIISKPVTPSLKLKFHSNNKSKKSGSRYNFLVTKKGRYTPLNEDEAQWSKNFSGKHNQFIKAEMIEEGNNKDYELSLSLYYPDKTNYLYIDEIISESIDEVTSRSKLYKWMKDLKIPLDRRFTEHLKRQHNAEQEEEENNYIGQTLLIVLRTKFLKPHDKSQQKKLKYFADKFLDILFEMEERPRFSRAGNLFKCPIFEYGLSSTLESNNYRHILVWFLCEGEDAENIFDDSYERLLGLFLFRAKIIHYFQQSHSIFKRLENSQKINNIIKGLNRSLANSSLTKLKIKLQQLMTEEINYEKELQEIERKQDLIIKYIRRYEERILQISGIYPNVNIKFLEYFSKETSRYFLEQIEADLIYLKDDCRLTEKAISLVRNNIEIEQANIEHQLNSIVLGATVAIGISGVLATSEVILIEENKSSGSVPNPVKDIPLIKFNPYILYALYILFIIIIAGLIGTVVGIMWYNRKSNKNSKKKR